MMDHKNHSPLVGWTRRKWLRRALAIGHSRSHIGGATRHRITVTVIVLVGWVTLIGLIMTSHRFELVMAAVFVSLGIVLIITACLGKGTEQNALNLEKAWLRIDSGTCTPMPGTEPDTMCEVIYVKSLTNSVTDFRSELAEFDAQPLNTEPAVSKPMLTAVKPETRPASEMAGKLRSIES